MKFALFSLLALSLAACSPNKDNTSGAPTALSDGIMNEAKATSENSPRVAAFLTRMNQKSDPVLPNTELILPGDSTDTQSSYRKLNSEGLMWLTKMKRDCSITPANHSTPGAQGTSNVTESITGQGCPIYYTKTTSTTNNFVQSGDTMSGTSDVTMQSTNQVMDPQLIQSSGSIRMTGRMDMHQQIFNATRDGGGTQSSNGTASFQVSTSEKNVNVTMKFEMVGSKSVMKLALVAHIATDEGSLSASEIVDGSHVEFYIGGQPATAQDFNDIFGFGSAVNPQTALN